MATWKTVRVFISSTFRDMHAERDHLVKEVFPRLRAWCEARRLHLVDIDLRWGVTKQEADNGKAIEICLKEIDGSRPFFVCILGNRYGWVPDRLPPEEIYKFQGLQADTHLSITHLEILHATQSPVSRVDGKSESVCAHSFFYLRDPKCIPQPDDVPEATREQFSEAFYDARPEREQQLDDLKRDINNRYSEDDRVFNYLGVWDPQAENPEDAALVGRLTRLEAFGMRVESDLIRGIRAQFAEHIAGLSKETDPLVEERSFHEAFIENRTQVHITRADVETKISEYVHGVSSQPLVLSGPPGSGKSSILANWVKENVDLDSGVTRNDGRILVLPRFIGASSASTNLARLLGNLCEELTSKYDLQEEIEEEASGSDHGPFMKRLVICSMIVPSEPFDILRKWPKFLEAAGEKANILIVIDAINQLDRTTSPTHLYWLPLELPANVKLVVSVLDTGDASKKNHLGKPGEMPDWLNLFRRLGYPELEVPVLDEESRRRIIRELPSVFCKSLDDEHIEALLANEATKSPLFLIVALDELRVFGSFTRLHERIATLPRSDGVGLESAIESIFGQVLDRLDREFMRAMPSLVPTLFAYLASAREGLSEHELEALLARKLPTLDPVARTGAMQVVLRQVRAYTMRKGTLIDFYHRSFWKAVRAKYLASTGSRHTAHIEIAEYFDSQDWFAESRDAQREGARCFPATPRPTNLRKVTELPWQRLATVGNWELITSSQRQPALSMSVTPSTASTNASTLGDCATESDYTAIESLFTTLHFLEAMNEAGLIFELVQDFANATGVLPYEREGRRILVLLEEALRRDIHFIARHHRDYPQALFQCLWNSCWWYDCPGAGKLYQPPNVGLEHTHPWNKPKSMQLCALLESWLDQRSCEDSEFYWIRAVRPPSVHLGTGRRMLLNGHLGEVHAVAYSPDGTFIVSGSSDRTVRVWDARSGKEFRCLNGHEGSVYSVACSPDGTSIASAAADSMVFVWNAGTGELMHLLSAHQGNEAYFYSRSKSPRHSHIASATRNKAIRVWDFKSGHEIHSLNGHLGFVRSVAYSPDGANIVSGADDRTIRVWDADSGSQVHCLTGHTRWVRSVAYSPDGTRIVSGSMDYTVRTWDSSSGEVLKCLKGHGGGVRCVAYSPDGSRIISAGDDHSIRIWDALTGKQIQCLEGHPEFARSVTYSSDGSRIIAESIDNSLREWNAHTFESMRIVHGANEFHEWVQCLAYSPDGVHIVTGSMDYKVRVFDARSGQELRCLDGHEGEVRCVAYSPDGYRIVSGSVDGTIRVWDTRVGDEVLCIESHGFFVNSVAYSPDGARIVAGHEDWTVRIWDAQSGDELNHLTGHRLWVRSVAYSSDGRRIVSGAADGTIRLWDAQSGNELHCIKGHERTVWSVAYAPDCTRIISGAVDHTVREWNVVPGEALRCLIGHDARVSSVDYCDGGAQVFSWAKDETIRIWDTLTGEHVHCLKGQKHPARFVKYSRDGDRIEMLTCDKTIRIWDLKSGTSIEIKEACDWTIEMQAEGPMEEFTLVAQGFDTVVRKISTNIDVAYYPTEYCQRFAVGNAGRTWAGNEGSNVQIMRLESSNSFSQ